MDRYSFSHIRNAFIIILFGLRAKGWESLSFAIDHFPQRNDGKGDSQQNYNEKDWEFTRVLQASSKVDQILFNATLEDPDERPLPFLKDARKTLVNSTNPLDEPRASYS